MPYNCPCSHAMSSPLCSPSLMNWQFSYVLGIIQLAFVIQHQVSILVASWKHILSWAILVFSFIWLLFYGRHLSRWGNSWPSSFLPSYIGIVSASHLSSTGALAKWFSMVLLDFIQQIFSTFAGKITNSQFSLIVSFNSPKQAVLKLQSSQMSYFAIAIVDQRARLNAGSN